MRESLTLVKVNDGKKNLAVLNMNNMIPVPQSCIIPFDFEEIQDKQYRNLLKKEFSICRNKKSSIQTKAQTVHQFVTLEPEKHQKMLAYCVDFKKIETFCLSYGEVSTKQVQPQNKFEARLAAAEAKKVKPESQEHHFKHL